MKPKKPYRLWQRKRDGYFMYRLPSMTGWKSTGETKRTAAVKVVMEKIRSGSQAPIGGRTFRQYAEPFFLWDECPHIKKLRDEGKSITKRTAKMNRSWLKNYVFEDLIAKRPIAEITRGELIDFRSRILEQTGGKKNTVNKVMGVVKLIFKEALFREDLEKDPTSGVGNIKESRVKPGVFTQEELKALFPSDSWGPWRGLQDYACFLLTATTGMRCSEILALKWRYVHLDQSMLEVREAWKSRTELGPPKWGHERIVPLPGLVVGTLTQLQEESIRIALDDLVFCYDDGTRLGNTWWRKRFIAAMEKAGIDRVGRNLKPHSFRHTLNSILRGKQYDDRLIQAALGWYEGRTQEKYTTWSVEQLRGQAEIIDGIFEPDT